LQGVKTQVKKVRQTLPKGRANFLISICPDLCRIPPETREIAQYPARVRIAFGDPWGLIAAVGVILTL